VPGAEAVQESVDQVIGDGAGLHAGARQDRSSQQGEDVPRICRHVQFALGGCQGEGGFVPFEAYARAKLLTTMTGYLLAGQLRETGITVNAVHPGRAPSVTSQARVDVDLAA
jgi:NAD(P)-dependent dehydrogenase (short-subunit alcohol dehydrogenase family)